MLEIGRALPITAMRLHITAMRVQTQLHKHSHTVKYIRHYCAHT